MPGRENQKARPREKDPESQYLEAKIVVVEERTSQELICPRWTKSEAQT